MLIVYHIPEGKNNRQDGGLEKNVTVQLFSPITLFFRNVRKRGGMFCKRPLVNFIAENLIKDWRQRENVPLNIQKTYKIRLTMFEKNGKLY